MERNVKGIVDYYNEMREADKELSKAKRDRRTTPERIAYLTQRFDKARQEYYAHC